MKGLCHDQLLLHGSETSWKSAWFFLKCIDAAFVFSNRSRRTGGTWHLDNHSRVGWSPWIFVSLFCTTYFTFSRSIEGFQQPRKTWSWVFFCRSTEKFHKFTNHDSRNSASTFRLRAADTFNLFFIAEKKKHFLSPFSLSPKRDRLDVTLVGAKSCRRSA